MERKAVSFWNFRKEIYDRLSSLLFSRTHFLFPWVSARTVVLSTYCIQQYIYYFALIIVPACKDIEYAVIMNMQQSSHPNKYLFTKASGKEHGKNWRDLENLNVICRNFFKCHRLPVSTDYLMYTLRPQLHFISTTRWFVFKSLFTKIAKINSLRKFSLPASPH